MDETNMSTRDLASRIETLAIDHPLSVEMRELVAAAITRLRLYDKHLAKGVTYPSATELLAIIREEEQAWRGDSAAPELSFPEWLAGALSHRLEGRADA